MRPPVAGFTTIRKFDPPRLHVTVDGIAVVKISRELRMSGRDTLRSPVTVEFGKSMYQPMCFGGESLAGGVSTVDHTGTLFETTRNVSAPEATSVNVCCSNWLRLVTFVCADTLPTESFLSQMP